MNEGISASLASGEKPIRALVVDDEPLARRLVVSLLEKAGGFEVAGQASDGASAVEAIKALQPDVTFFDIHMPGMDGIAAAREVADLGGVVVFITAYDEHALAAFEAQGFDYVMKPVDKARFSIALERIRQDIRRRRIATVFEASALAQGKRGANHLDHIKQKNGAEIRFVPVTNIIWLEGSNQYVTIHEESGFQSLISQSLRSFEQQLDPQVFFRVHRSAIVNRHAVASVLADAKGAVYLALSNGQRIRVSRRFKAFLAPMMMANQAAGPWEPSS